MPVKVITDRSNFAFGAIREALGEAVLEIAHEVEANAKKRILGGPKSGRFYRRKGGRMHQASAENEAPANDYGGLANSIKAVPTGPLQATVTVGKGYGAELEQRKKRPFLGPARDEVEEQMPEIVQKAIDRKLG